VIRLHFYGSCRGITGSQYILETSRSRVMLDCGLYQGGDDVQRRLNRSFHVPPNELDALILSHAHLDHSGLVPHLVKQGFSGRVWCHHATRDLCEILLNDAGHLQEEEAAYENRHRAKRRLPAVVPLYTVADAQRSLQSFHPIDYGKWHDVTPDVRVAFASAGHILGSSLVQVEVKLGKVWKRLVFTGDLGHHEQALLAGPEMLRDADWLIMESTYGDRDQLNRTSRLDQLGDLVNRVAARNGVILIPAFAVGRSQDVLWGLRALLKEGRIPSLPITLDSPMAIATSKLFHRYPGQLRPEVRPSFENKHSPLEFQGVSFSRSVADSMALNESDGPRIIISASGMCTGGRILHHLRRRLPDPANAVLIVGYQASATLGRRLQETVQMPAPKPVDIHGRQVAVGAEIATMDTYSAHADRRDILHWASHFQPRPKTVFLVHGDTSQSLPLAHTLEERFGDRVHVPVAGEVVDLLDDSGIALR
jgi:metallo-beta-lactamase family protein